jgi:heme A synthase
MGEDLHLKCTLPYTWSIVHGPSSCTSTWHYDSSETVLHMTTDSTGIREIITGRHCYLLLTASILTYLLITMGGVVCVTNSGLGCPDWPGCYGQIIPPMRMDAIIEYLHRLIAALTTPFIIAAAIVGWRKSRSVRWVSISSTIAVAFLVAVIVFGALAVLQGLSPLLATVDLGLALLVLALLLAASVVAFAHYDNPALPDRFSFRSPFTRLSLWTLVAVFTVLVSGILTAESDSITRCMGWPLYIGRWAPIDRLGLPQMVRLLIAGVASLLVVAVVIQAWRTQREQRAILRIAIAVGVVFLVEMTVGALLLTYGFTLFLLVTYVAAAAALWGLVVVLVVLTGVSNVEGQKANMSDVPMHVA